MNQQQIEYYVFCRSVGFGTDCHGDALQMSGLPRHNIMLVNALDDHSIKGPIRLR